MGGAIAVATTRRVWSAFAGTLAAATAAYAAARSSLPAADPSYWEVFRWAVSGRDLLAALASAFAGLSGGYAIWQMFSGTTPSTAAVAEIVEIAASEHSRQLSMVTERLTASLDLAVSKNTEIVSLVSSDVVERVTAAVKVGAIPKDQCRELVSILTRVIAERASTSLHVSVAFAEAVGYLVSSPKAALREAGASALTSPVQAARDVVASIAPDTDLLKAAGEMEAARKLTLPFDSTSALSVNVALKTITNSEEGRDGWLRLSDYFIELGDFERAAYCANESLGRSTTDDEKFDAVYQSAVLGYWREDLDQAAALARKAIAVYGAHSDTWHVTTLANVLKGYTSIVHVLHEQGRAGDAEQIARGAAPIFDSLNSHDNVELKSWLSTVYYRIRLAEIEEAKGNYDTASSMLLTLVKILEKRVSQEEKVSDAYLRIADIYSNLGDMAGQRNKFHEALEHYVCAAKAARKHCRLNDMELFARGSLVLVLCRVGVTYHNLGRNDDARIELARARRVAEELVGVSPAGDTFQMACALVYGELSIVEHEMGNEVAARGYILQASRMLDRLRKLRPTNQRIARLASRIETDKSKILMHSVTYRSPVPRG